MVSGLVTSPCDQLRIFSGDANMMRMASKSVIGLVSSNGFERNKATLQLLAASFPGLGSSLFLRAFSCQLSALSYFRAGRDAAPSGQQCLALFQPPSSTPGQAVG